MASDLILAVGIPEPYADTDGDSFACLN